MSSVVLAKCLWAISKPDIQICFYRRFVEGCGEGAGWAFVISMVSEDGGGILGGGVASGGWRREARGEGMEDKGGMREGVGV